MITGCAGSEASDVGVDPPDGTRWVGTADVMVAVPEGWRLEADMCPPSEGNVVWFRSARSESIDCSAGPTVGSSFLQVSSLDPHVRSRAAHLKRHRVIDGLGVRHNRIVCRVKAERLCSLTFSVPEAGAGFHAAYRGPRPRRFLTDLRGSLRAIPPGYTSVPLIDYGTSVEAAQERLGSVGLDGRSPEVNFPHYATGTEPEAGTVVEIGSRVTVTIGDG